MINSYMIEAALYLNQYTVQITTIAFLSSFILGFIDIFPLAYSSSDDAREAKKKLLRRTCIGILMLMLATALYASYLNTHTITKFNNMILVVLFVYGKIMSFIWLRYLKPLINNYFMRYKVAQTGDEVSDIRAEINKVKSKVYDPEDHYKEGYMFYGLDDDGKPIYDTINDWKKNHQASIGPTQWGKGVNIGLQVRQAILQNCTVVLIDPKPDMFMRSIAKQACEEEGRKFVEIDLTGDWATQKYAFLKSGSLRDKRDRLIRYIGLNPSGTNADFYKLGERKHLNKIIDALGNNFTKLSKLREKVETKKGVDDLLPQTSAALYELNLLSNICDKGICIQDEIQNNSVIYVRASIVDKAIQKTAIAVLEDVIQSAISTSKKFDGKRESHLFVVIDELRFLVNNYIADVLASIKDTDTHMLVTYQSMLDLRNVSDQDVDKEALEKSIDVNTTTKLIYRCIDDETAEWVAKQTGTKQISVIDRVGLEVNTYGGEEQTGDAFLTKVEEYLFPVNLLLVLPPKVCVLIRPNHLAQLTFPHWVKIDTDKHKPQMQKNALKPRSKPVLSHNKQKYAATREEKDNSKEALTPKQRNRSSFSR